MTDKKPESFGEIVKHVDKTFEETRRLVDKNFNQITLHFSLRSKTVSFWISL